MSKRLYIWGIPIDQVNMEQAKARLQDIMAQDGLDIIVTPNPEIIMNAMEDLELKALIESSSLAIPDGISIVYASKIMGKPLEERITGIDFLTQVLKLLNEKKMGIYLLGGGPACDGEEAVCEKAGANMRKRFPELIISGSHHGYFGPEEETSIVEDIRQSGASFLCVAMGSPRQEKFIQAHREELSNIRGAMGVGGSLDVWAGRVNRAPAFYQKHGLEWLYRLVKEPVRLKRMAKIPLFMVKVLVTRGE
ncbi:MAG: WecB/TagA/CpsF family glycosyltransferase [Anaerovoracaceae bacterium]|jgi:N-acetylglucosaminyldiphosphoundecaprenol N-acetyl-beta-D-mannosaminyltransferase|nr:WecB/TagA/CpsF family glycosyltransferase [Anaerovoracaceae bacterium]